MNKIIIDSDIDLRQALIQDPGAPPAPKEILDRLELVDVEYLSFDRKLHRGQIVINKTLTADVKAIFKKAVKLEFPIAKLVPNSHPGYLWDTRKLVFEDNVSAGFGFRMIKGKDKLSLHAYGRAIDINPMQNPYIRYQNGKKIVFPDNVKWNPNKPGTLYANHRLVKFAESLGWEWGGKWTEEDGVTDYMHIHKEA